MDRSGGKKIDERLRKVIFIGFANFFQCKFFLVFRLWPLDLATFDLNIGFYMLNSSPGTTPYVWKPSTLSESHLPNFFRYQS